MNGERVGKKKALTDGEGSEGRRNRFVVHFFRRLFAHSIKNGDLLSNLTPDLPDFHQH